MLKISKYLTYLGYGISYIIKTKILRKKIPLIAGLVLGESCNLNCKHCSVGNKSRENDLSIKDIEKGLNKLYDKGIRLLAITGGEPFIWKDGNYAVEDVVCLARKIGFKIISIYTNGSKKIETTADTVFVSIDGTKETSNKLRGNIYDLVIKNIKKSSHTNIIVNFTINNENKHTIEQFCEYCKDIKNIKGIFFYFHTPYYGKDELYITFPKKQKIIKEILKLKKTYKILNSSSCLWDVYHDTRERPSDLCLVYANNQIYKCCRSIGNEDVCKECGYLGYPEIINISKLKLSAIGSALNYLPKK